MVYPALSTFTNFLNVTEKHNLPIVRNQKSKHDSFLFTFCWLVECETNLTLFRGEKFQDDKLCKGNAKVCHHEVIDFSAKIIRYSIIYFQDFFSSSLTYLETLFFSLFTFFPNTSLPKSFFVAAKSNPFGVSHRTFAPNFATLHSFFLSFFLSFLDKHWQILEHDSLLRFGTKATIKGLRVQNIFMLKNNEKHLF